MDATPQNTEKLMMSANLHRLRGELNEAETLVRAVLQRYPQDAFALEFLGDLLAQKGDFSGSEAAYRAVLQDNPGRAAVEDKLARMILRTVPTGSMTTASGTPLRTDRNPFTVVILSLVFPGAGHFYMGDRVKGLLFSAGTLLIGFAMVPMIFAALGPVMGAISSGVSAGGLEDGGTLKAPALSPALGLQSALYTLLMTALYIYSCFDAFVTAKRVYRPK